VRCAGVPVNLEQGELSFHDGTGLPVDARHVVTARRRQGTCVRVAVAADTQFKFLD